MHGTKTGLFTAPVLERPEPLRAPALKALQEAGWCGRESIVRWQRILIYSFSAQKRQQFNIGDN